MTLTENPEDCSAMTAFDFAKAVSGKSNADAVTIIATSTNIVEPFPKRPKSLFLLF